MSKGEVSEPKNKMTPEQLLKPRYKVVADFPDNDYEVGAIFPINDEGYYDYDPTIRAERMDNYPHLYRKLLWYQDRKPEEQPEYVKRIVTSEETIFYKKELSPLRYKRLDKDEYLIMSLGVCFPATETEYNQYLKTKQK